MPVVRSIRGDRGDKIRSHIGEGIDLKHGGTGFVVALPSIHPNGTAYEWLIPPPCDPATGFVGLDVDRGAGRARQPV